MIVFFIVVFALLIAIFVFFGGFYKVNLRIENTGGESIFYESVIGSYHHAHKIIDRVYKELLSEYKIEATKAIGIYYDNPKNVHQRKLISNIGCIVENIDKKTIEKVKERFQYKKLPVDDYVVAEFPFRGSYSIIIGMTRVHPMFRKYFFENHYEDRGIIEIYDYPNNKIIYRNVLKESD